MPSNRRPQRRSLSAIDCSEALCRVMSRETANRRSGRPSAPRIGVTCTSHHFGVPLRVSAGPWKCPVPPDRAVQNAALASACACPCQNPVQSRPSTWLKSSASITARPPSFMKVSRASGSSTLMQSAEEARTPRMNAASACSLAAAFRSAVRSRRIFRKPSCRPPSSISGIISPLAQNRVPSLRRCQRSSAPRPCRRAAPISFSGMPSATSSSVKNTPAGRPRISASDQPRIRSAPGDQLVTRPFRSMETMA